MTVNLRRSRIAANGDRQTAAAALSRVGRHAASSIRMSRVYESP